MLTISVVEWVGGHTEDRVFVEGVDSGDEENHFAIDCATLPAAQRLAEATVNNARGGSARLAEARVVDFGPRKVR